MNKTKSVYARALFSPRGDLHWHFIQFTIVSRRMEPYCSPEGLGQVLDWLLTPRVEESNSRAERAHISPLVYISLLWFTPDQHARRTYALSSHNKIHFMSARV